MVTKHFNAIRFVFDHVYTTEVGYTTCQRIHDKHFGNYAVQYGCIDSTRYAVLCVDE